jgi:hypothetical protein
MATVKNILSKQRGLNPLARYPYSTPIQVVLSAITFLALTVLVTGLFDLFLVRDPRLLDLFPERDPRLASLVVLAVMAGGPFMLGIIIHRWWATLITPAASVLAPLVHNLWQCKPQFSCLGDDIGLSWLILWISIPAFCGWLGFKLRG